MMRQDQLAKVVINNLAMVRTEHTSCKILAKNSRDLEAKLEKSVDAIIANACGIVIGKFEGDVPS